MAGFFRPVPLIINTPEYIEKVAGRIFNEEYIGHNISISTIKEDNAPFIIVGGKEPNILIDDIVLFQAYGLFANHQYNEEYGIKYLQSMPVQTITLNRKDLREYYIFLIPGSH
ncbi:hypothetical protein [Sporosarcina highlanderae]|uniref:Uncharacterized protein n=1 Tax=Sporosarcina highlanderae TaxID=3035916 RepID=A0ABT8JNU2_9BACL|nr:hypothetical protein [Sporosarcina highlanderae]MDN4606806.1 hypothetical protein [Sporosarcina highlanderae]